MGSLKEGGGRLVGEESTAESEDSVWLALMWCGFASLSFALLVASAFSSSEPTNSGRVIDSRDLSH